ncbi:hypothetical protein N7533_006509 [Penicillium manginii]|jgi:hypothetical protein|uniref:uncharacterized protein n=1 Tax=Penicillium manginii TaxID=203109 RepID=UPI002546E946|nr:uncharacterized protein N7533_006509 [Penicillium manginii]KAJ5749481.1 hypothetical protein N7533_006509 [Penicillium manginii]
MATIDDIEELERELGQQRVENAYYRDCYALFKLLQDLTENTSQDLQRLYNSESSNDLRRSGHEILWSLQNTIFNIIEKACDSEKGLENLCLVDSFYSARATLEPIRTRYTDTEATHGAQQTAMDIALKPWRSRKEGKYVKRS